MQIHKSIIAGPSGRIADKSALTAQDRTFEHFEMAAMEAA
jgi:hypothetical protein